MMGRYRKLRASFQNLDEVLKLSRQTASTVNDMRMALGRIEGRQVDTYEHGSLASKEFKVFSQWGEDGIIYYLTQIVEIENEIFVELGVEDYRESNTRFLLQNLNWSGLALDSSENNVQSIRNDDLYWRHNLKAMCNFIDADNVNTLLSNAGIHGDIGLLSIDIDGNDYWIWKNLSAVSPRIVICEYNSLFGPVQKYVVPYEAEFDRTHAHFSNLYWGASIAALEHLATEKGYKLVGSNSAGNNAFFVREDLLGPSLTPVPSKEAYVRAKFRESRDQTGALTFLNFKEARELIQGLPVLDLDLMQTVVLLLPSDTTAAFV